MIVTKRIFEIVMNWTGLSFRDSLSGIFGHFWQFEILVILAVSLLVRVPSFGRSVIDPDETMYILIAKEVLNGHLPYLTIFQEKPLGAPLFTSLIMYVFGLSIVNMRVLGTVAIMATAILLRAIAQKLDVSRLGQIGVPVIFIVTSARLGGLPTNTEIMFLPFTVAAVLVAIRYEDARGYAAQRAAILLMGSLVGVSIWFKYIAGFTGCVLFAWLVGTWLLRNALTIRPAVILALYYTAMCSFLTVAGAMAYAAMGHWGEFWWSNIGFMGAYIAVHDPFWVLVYRIVWGISHLGIALTLAIAGLAFVELRNSKFILIVAWLAAETVALAAPWKFFDHYFLLILPPLCILAGMGIDAMESGSQKFRHGLILTILTLIAVDVFTQADMESSLGAVLIFIAVIMIFIVTASRLLHKIESANFWRQTRSPKTMIHGIIAGLAMLVTVVPSWTIAMQPDPERRIADTIRDDARKLDDRPHNDLCIWIVNDERGLPIYLLSESKIPTKYVFPHFLDGTYENVARIDADAEIRRIIDSRPTYLVVDPAKWKWPDRSKVSFIKAHLDESYDLVSRVTTTNREIDLYRLRD